MPSLLSFVAEADADCHACLSRMAADVDSQTIPQLVTFLDQDKFRKLMAGFVENRSDVVNFSFWWQYMYMVAILLQYTRAQRGGIWELHIYSFSLMLPYFKRYDHLNYARCGPVYLEDMHPGFQNPFYQISKEAILL